MSTLNKVNIPVAKKAMTKLDLSCDHVTTMDFMKFQPVYYRHMLAGEHLNFDCFANIRPSAMVTPTYGRIRCNLRGFFVPYRLAFPQWSSFKEDVIASGNGSSSLVSSPPYMTSDDVVYFFMNPLVSSPTNVPSDFTDGASYYTLTNFGRFCYKVLYSLGYDILPKSGAVSDLITWNCLALLSVAKIYVDWYANQNYLNSSDVLLIQQALSQNDPINSYHVDSTFLFTVFNFMYTVCYDSNGYFEQCFDTANPASPVGNQYSPQVAYDIAAAQPSNAFVTLDSNGTPVMNQNTLLSPNPSIGSEYLHQMLARITSYQLRHGLAGANAVDRFLVEHGFVANSMRLLRSTYVGEQSIDVNIGDIYATAAGSDGGSDTTVLGDYSGRGFGAGKKTWDFTSDEEGIFIVLASIVPSAGYYQGYDRNNRHLDKTDFFTDEYDGTIGVIEKGEVFVTQELGYINKASDVAGIFGFCGRYGEMKRPINRVSGDISLHSVMVGGSAWHLMRDLTGVFPNYAGVVHSLQFTKGSDGQNYNRIFYNYDSSGKEEQYDNFYCFFHFDVGAYAPCLPLFDMLEFPEDTKQITSERGAKVN